MEVSSVPHFNRFFKKLPTALQDEAIEKIELFKDSAEHPSLKVHKLHGKFKDCFSFSVNYRYRIVFMWEKKNESAILLAIGDHALYD